MDRLFDINLNTADGWTDGESWDDCNPAQELNEVYHRVYSESPEDDPNFRINQGDAFLIAAHPTVVRDWTPKTIPWTFDIDGASTGKYSFYFGLQLGDAKIDTNLESHSPWITGVVGEFISLDANFHCFYSLRVKDSDPVLTLKKDVTGTVIQDAVFNNSALIDTAGFRMFDWLLRNLTFLNTVFRFLDIPISSANVSTQDFVVTGAGDIGLAIRSGHSSMEIIGGSITNEAHNYLEDEKVYHGVEVETGGEVTIRYVKTEGFSGHGFYIDCPANIKGLESDHDGAGSYFGEFAIVEDSLVTWTRQLEGDSYAYYFYKGGELNNSGCNLDETGGLGVVVIGPNSTLTINGGDYRANLPLPFLYATGTCTVVLNYVKVNGVLHNETIELLEGEAWRGEKAEVTMDALPVYANKTLSLPYMHIPKLAEAISVQGSDRPFSTQIDLPSGARIVPTQFGSLRYMPLDAWLHLDPGETAIDYFRYSTETLIYMHQFTIHASPEVGAKVVQPDSFAGAGWVKSGGKYTASNTSTALVATGTFEADEVYQVSLKTSDVSGGGVKPYFDGEEPEFIHTLNGTSVWLLRAPSGTSEIKIKAEGFTGIVENIYTRQLLRAATPPIPELSGTATASGVDLKFEVLPVYRIRDFHTATIHKTGVLAQNEQDGYRNTDEDNHYLFENIEVSNRRNGINLRGAESLEVFRMSFVGGYGQNVQEGETLEEDYPYARWQTGITGEYGDDKVKIQQLMFCDIDLLLESNFGNYTGDFGNSDCIVINNSYSDSDAFAYEATIYGCDLRNGSDGVTDIKRRCEVNYSYYEGACKMLRSHSKGSVTVCNTEFVRTYGVREVFFPSHDSPYIEIWNCMVDNQRCVNIEQLKNQPKGFGRYADYSPARTRTRLVHVLNTYPTLNDYSRAEMTDMEFRYSDDDGFSWGVLEVPNVGLPGVVGCFKRSIDLPQGTYVIRCRCRNGGLIGNWSNEILITI